MSWGVGVWRSGALGSGCLGVWKFGGLGFWRFGGLEIWGLGFERLMTFKLWAGRIWGLGFVGSRKSGRLIIIYCYKCFSKILSNSPSGLGL